LGFVNYTNPITIPYSDWTYSYPIPMSYKCPLPLQLDFHAEMSDGTVLDPTIFTYTTNENL
jgi:hypothetical protein